MDIQPGLQRPLRIACVTETYPPEVNGVAMTIARLVQSLRARHHARAGGAAAPGRATPARRRPTATTTCWCAACRSRATPGLRMGLPCKGTLVQAVEAAAGPTSCTSPPKARWAAPRCWPPGRWACRCAPTSAPTSTPTASTTASASCARPIIGYLRRFHNATQCTMVPTQALHDDLAGEGFRDLLTVARGVDVRRFDAAHRSEALRAQWGAAPDDLVVTCVGRLAPEKNLVTLVAAFEAIRREQPRARLVLVGDGPMRKELQARCPDAVFAGQRIGDDLAAHYASADLFLFPERHRDLRQRHHRGDGQRPRGGRVRLRRRAAPDPRTATTARWCRSTTTPRSSPRPRAPRPTSRTAACSARARAPA